MYKICVFLTHLSLQEEYDQLSQKIEEAVNKSAPFELTDAEFVVFSNIERKNHPTIIKVQLIRTTVPFFLFSYLLKAS